MANYGVLAQVQRKLRIDTTDTRFDTHITEALEAASRYIDNELRKYTAVPVTTNDTLDDIANAMATGIYREDQAGLRGEMVMTDPARKSALAALKVYIDGTYNDTTGNERRFFVEVAND